MPKELFFLQKNHNNTKRNYLQRMQNNKVFCMGIAKKYENQYWDGNRKFGYGGYRYIPGRLTKITKLLIKRFKLTNKSKILDIGCGKGFLLYEIKKILPGATVVGLDISKHGIKNCHPSLKNNLKIFDAKKKLPFKNGQFDLALSFGLYHNFSIFELEKSLKEFSRVSKKNYLMVESYQNDKQLFNLQCWALTCESFFSPKEWEWIFKKFKYKGDYEFIYFN
jgi:ubiquinone/menaquinone biosynthesis C-methylase UbiE